MSQKRSNSIDINSFFQQLHSEGVAETMECNMLADLGLGNPSADMNCKYAFRYHGKHFSFSFGSTQYPDGGKRQWQLNLSTCLPNAESEICLSSSVMMYVLPSECKDVASP